MQFKKITLLVATEVLAITLSAGVAYAVPGNNPTSSPTVNAVTENVGAKDKVEKHRECGAEFAGILGMDAKVLGQELKSGKTLAKIAADKGIDIKTLTQKVEAQFNDKIDKAVANGKQTKDKAAAIKAKTSQKVASAINEPWTGHKGEAGKENVFMNVRQQIPALLGMDAIQLKEQLKSGKTLAQIAQDKGIAKDNLVSDVQSIMKANLDQAVKDKKVTADKATQIKSKLPQMIERMVTRVDND
ncbi:hypothetical protein [Desulfosporosinus metallidurans]|uniref:LysM domain-containing protein n=1 Tax=Desulfosporosinus metallidurans TaxID=1888891 RepID=A0A1Q8R1Z2_9FIRM|nr:hypothetical protein [Desulfosporosinus metallidurans]OLN33609.1 hypothetical protein DSOL_0319 [Desulfosporosinus metallidurans]